MPGKKVKQRAKVTDVNTIKSQKVKNTAIIKNYVYSFQKRYL